MQHLAKRPVNFYLVVDGGQLFGSEAAWDVVVHNDLMMASTDLPVWTHNIPTST